MAAIRLPLSVERIPVDLAPRRFKLDVAPFIHLWQAIGPTRPERSGAVQRISPC
ncbi:hypothetical protein KJ682_12825 [bacterium]|nr:hypothetical protein [bacterium]